MTQTGMIADPAAAPVGIRQKQIACRRARQDLPSFWPSAPVGGRLVGGEHGLASFQFSLPPQWLHRCTTGDQPPDTATQSAAISSVTTPEPEWAQSDALDRCRP